ncbi:MAG: IS66 family transposase [Ruminiclostridium sp.]
MGGNYEKDIFRQLQEIMTRCDGMSQEIKDIKKEHKQELKSQEIRFQEDFAKERKIFTDRIDDLECELVYVKTENELLKNDNERMKRIMNNDSSNSSNPPSSDQKGKNSNQYNSRKKQDRKCGGQKGHKGKTLMEAEIQEGIQSGLFKHKVVGVGTPKKEYHSKYVLDLEIAPIVTEYRFYSDAVIPAEQHSAVVYGPTIKTYAVDLYGEGAMSVQRIENFLNGICNGIKISTGSIYNFLRDFGVKAEPHIELISTRLLNSEVLYTDATVVRCEGKNAYIRNQSTEDAVLYTPMLKKDIDSLHEVKVLDGYTETLVHDHETALYHFGTDHAECNVHLGRYLRKNSEESGNSWSKEMEELFKEMNSSRKEKKKHTTSFSKEEIISYETRFDILLNKGYEENAHTKGKYAKESEKTLLNRLKKHKSNHLLFLRDFNVAYDNNLSERDLRKCKTKQKVSGCFRKHSGNELYCKVMSFIETCKRKNLSVLHSIQNVFTDRPVQF